MAGINQHYDWEGKVQIGAHRHAVGIDDNGDHTVVYTSAKCPECGAGEWIDATDKDQSAIECADCGNVEQVTNITRHYLQGVD